jgi:CheY-like chemotaxis protein
MRLLWVENHAVFARIAGRQFLSAHVVTVVASLAEARKALIETAFDAVLLDYDLDDGKGTSLVPAIQNLSTPPVVIGVSSHEAGNAALLQAGVNAVCSKGRFAEIEAILVRAVSDRDRA